jgi:formate-dependent nitrite reductase cytochrome c552 subunit
MSRKICAFIAGAALLSLQGVSTASVDAPPKELSKETKACVACHQKHNPGIVQQWGDSKHYGASVGCYECHAADASDVDAFIHDIWKTGEGKPISIIVSPKDCSNCHEKEVKEYTESHHAQGGRILGSMDNLLAEVVEGNTAFKTEATSGESAAVVNGCWQCHGTEVKVLKNEKGEVTGLDPATWPNTGIGRLNPDGSRGSCTACHSRHNFSVAQSRQPENCGKCHMGPDHPQYEIYIESKHGIAFRANVDKMNLDNPKWIAGEDYDAAPTCATCHMSATREQGVTHDVGLRISWTNRPAISVRPEISDAKMGLPGANVKWDERRDNMKDVCSACHSEAFVDGFYVQYDGLINLYNTKFAIPGLALYKAAKPLFKRQVKFANEIDFVWFEIWHHEGRRARHGASMQGPDWTHWHGTYEVGKHFYTEYVPLLEELIEANIHSKDAEKQKIAENLKALLDQILNDEFVVNEETGEKSTGHLWFIGKMSAEEIAARKKEREEFENRYKTVK